MKKHIVVFDGTSASIIDISELQWQKDSFQVEVLDTFNDIDDAFDFCDFQNDLISD